MLTKSWIVFNGVGEQTESKLWGKGFFDWSDEHCFSKACGEFPKLRDQNPHRLSVLDALKSRNAKLLAQNLPSNETWRLWHEFKENALFLDIESDGIGQWSKITVIGTYFQGQYRAFVQGEDLDEAWDLLNQASLIVSFNGRQFDVPFIERHFGKSLGIPHIDLRFVAASLGYRGGLKKIEPQFGIKRDPNLKDIDGYQAVLLWRKSERGDNEALKLLIDYNQADVENLIIIMRECWERKLDMLSVVK